MLPIDLDFPNHEIGKEYPRFVANNSLVSSGWLMHVPSIGLLHCEVASASSYFPVSMTNFQESKVHTWVLGHIHKPDILSEAPFVFYPGTPQGLDPSEDGAHGLWLLDIEQGLVSNSELLVSSGSCAISGCRNNLSSRSTAH